MTIWQYPVRGSISNLNFPKIEVKDRALYFGFSDFLQKSKCVDFFMEGRVLKYPDLLNVVFFKVRAELVKMGKISKEKDLSSLEKI